MLGALEFELQQLDIVDNGVDYGYGVRGVRRQAITLTMTGEFLDVLCMGGQAYIGREIPFTATIETTQFRGKIRVQSFFVSEPLDGARVGKLTGDLSAPVKIKDLRCPRIDVSTHCDPNKYRVIHHPNCRCLKELKLEDPDYSYVTREECEQYLKSKEDTVEKVTAEDIKKNKFYVGHKSTFTHNWGHADIKAAIAHGTELVEDNGEDQIVVKIVKVIRRKKQPVTVQDVK